MANDRVIKWAERKPSSDELGLIIEDYCRGIAKVDFSVDRWFIYLLGSPYPALIRVVDPIFEKVFSQGLNTSRWIEAYPHQDCTYVITRQQDEITNAIADGLVALLVRFYGAKLEGE